MSDSSYTKEPLTSKSPKATPRLPNRVLDIPRDKIKLTLANRLIQAILTGNLQKIQHLLDRGVQLTGKNDYGFGPLVAALYIEDEKKRDRVFHFLLDTGASYKARDEHNNRSVLLWACVLGRNNQVRVLLEEAGGDINLMDKDNGGSTAMHHAVLNGNLSLVELLTHYYLRFGVSVDIVDSRGFTSYLLARRLGYTEIADYLNRKGLASVGHSDFLFRSPREWSQFGKFERKKAMAISIEDRINTSKVQGRPIKCTSQLEEFHKIYSIHTVPLQNYQQLIKQSYFSKNKSDLHRAMVGKPVQIPLDTHSLVVNQLDRTHLLHRPTPEFKKVEMSTNGIKSLGNSSFKYEYNSSTVQVKTSDALSLLEQSSSTKGRTVSHFHPSELDVNKVVEYKHMLGNIGMLMNILAEQTTKSYRRPIKGGKPAVQEEISPKIKNKVSTFAALFGSKKGTPRKRRFEKSKQTMSPVKKNPGLRGLTINSESKSLNYQS